MILQELHGTWQINLQDNQSTSVNYFVPLYAQAHKSRTGTCSPESRKCHRSHDSIHPFLFFQQHVQEGNGVTVVASEKGMLHPKVSKRS